MHDNMFGFIYARINYKVETLFATLKGTLNFYIVLLKRHFEVVLHLHVSINLGHFTCIMSF